MDSKSKPGKKPLQQWLQEILDTETCAGVRWTDKSSKIFKIPWQNQKSANWDEKLCDIFLQYAKHSGKFKPDGKKMFPKFKQNFKCAITKNNFIKRLDSQSQSHRLYMLLDCGSQKALKRGHSNQKKRTTNQRVQEEISHVKESHSIVNCNIKYDLYQDTCQTKPICGSETLSSLDLILQDLPIPMGNQTNGAEMNCLQTVESERNSEMSQVEQNRCDSFNDTSTQMISSQNSGENKISQNLNLLDRNQQELNAELNLIPTFIQSMVISSSTSHGVEDIPISNLTNDFVEGLMNPVSEHDIIKSSMAISDITASNESPRLLLATEDESLLKQDLNTPTQDLSCSLSEIQNSLNSSSSMDTFDSQNSLDQSKPSKTNNVASSKPAESDNVQTIDTIPPSVSEMGLMRLQVIYGTPHKVVMTEFVRTNKCRIFFGKIAHKRLKQQIEQADNGSVEIELPSVDKFEFNVKSKERIRNVLQILELGVVLTYRDDDIYVARRCQSHVYLSDGILTSKKLPRGSHKLPDQETEAFNFNKHFKDSIKLHREDKKNVVERDHFMLTFGCQILFNDPSPTKVVPVYIVVEHLKAAYMRYKELGDEAYEPAPTYSMSNSFENEQRLANKFSSL